MKKAMSLLLVLTMVLSLLFGCGKPAAQESTPQVPATAPNAETAAPTTEPTTEPTLSPEELLYNSLTERQRQAVDVGIVELSQLEDLERECTIGEAARMVRNARVLMYGEESVMMAAAMESSQKELPVTRYWLIQAMYISAVERYNTPPFTDYYSNLSYMTWGADPEPIFIEVSAGNNVTENFKGAYFSKWYDDDAVLAHEYWSGFADAMDCIWNDSERRKAENLVDSQSMEPIEWGEGVFYTCGSQNPVDWGSRAYDRTTGAKLMPVDENGCLNPAEEITVGEVVELTLRYYNSKAPEPEMVAYADAAAYDAAIITDELLNRETTLPEASCAELPSQWHGVMMRDLLTKSDGSDNDPKVDTKIYQNEIQAIKDAGFNYVKILIDFRYYHAENDNYFWGTKPQAGVLNETHLKELDQIIAWCMERDIHVNLTCAAVMGWPEQMHPDAILAKAKYAEPLAEQWQLLARRYAQIPNTYLSFTLFHEPEIRSENYYAQFFPQVVEAIREVSPDRCVIAEISGQCTGDCMAQMGVALASKTHWPEAFEIDGSESRFVVDKLFAEATWPYESRGTQMDGETVMTNRAYGWVTPDAVAATAEQYGVGYMVSSWAPAISYGNSVRRERFTDETMQAYLTDMTETMAARGYGWCYGNWFSFVGIGAAYPAIGSTTYTRINNTPLYIDDETMSWFQKINGVQ